MKIKGRVWKFGENINTDDIIPARYLNLSDPTELAKHCFEYTREGFCQEVRKGDIIVSGRNFGCGSSREHAPQALKALGIACIIAPSFARIFFRNALNIGLPVVEINIVNQVAEGEVLEIEFEKGIIFNQSKNESYSFSPFPLFMQKLLSEGGLMNYVKHKIRKRVS